MTRSRTPANLPPRIQPLAVLPVFHKLTGRRVIMAGAGEGLVWKVELLAATGAEIMLYAQDEHGDLAELGARLKGQPGVGSVTMHQGSPPPDAFTGAALAIGAYEDLDDAARFVAHARAAGVPVNVVDKPEFCDFSFGALVNRSPLVIGISTDGAAPVLGQAVRSRMEALLPQGLADWAAAARDWRARILDSFATMAERRQAWRFFAQRAMRHADRAPDESDLAAILSEENAPVQGGSVALVGAGPGDPDLLTIKAVRALQGADVILFDDLVSDEVLDLARREAERISVGKTGFKPSCTQRDINQLMVSLALSGKLVVRLKSGDPLIFGRATEEVEACRDAGLPVEIVPGISAAQGAAASLTVSLTERYTARRLQLVTGHGADGKLPMDIDWKALADPAAASVVYMPRRSFAALAQRVQEAGLPGDTPAVAVLSASRPDQVTLASTVGALASALPQLDDGPVVILLGAVFRSVVSSQRVGTGFSPR